MGYSYNRIFLEVWEKFSLIYFIIMPLLLCLVIMLIPQKNIRFIKHFSLWGSFLIFVFINMFWERVLSGDNVNIFTGGFINEYYPLVFSEGLGFVYNINLYMDGISFTLVSLTSLLIFICLVISWNSINFREKEHVVLFLIIESMLFAAFLFGDLLLFYFFYEAVLIPMFLMIGVWGSRKRKVYAVYKFFFYTFVGSLPILLCIVYLGIKLGSFSYSVLNYETTSLILSLNEQKIISLLFFLGFMVKIPSIPFHIWLTEAHVEAPTAGSVLLAGILLKLGGYALIRWVIEIFSLEVILWLQPFVFLVSFISLLFASLVTIVQVDLKRIIAYSSIAHMSFVTAGIFSLTEKGFIGAIYVMLSHGLISSALFICVGVIYDRYGNKNIGNFGGLVYGMPFFTLLFFFFTIGNMGIPMTSSFIAEFLSLLGLFQLDPLYSVFMSLGIILGAIYSIWMFNRVVYGDLKSSITGIGDLNKSEFKSLFLLGFLMILFGIFPDIILSIIEPNTKLIIEWLKIK